jgi:hypothetical protein
LLFDIPETNYASEFYKKNEDIIKQILGLVDGVIVSTKKLKDQYLPYCKNIQVIENKLPKFLWHTHNAEEKLNPENIKKLKIVYPGSQNHFGCKLSIKKEGGDFGIDLLNYIKKTTDIYDWVFIGGKPCELEDEFKENKVEYHGWKSIYEYPRFLKSLNAHIGLAPLENNLFNECKSNLKALEYTASGHVGIFSDLEPYKNMPITCKTDNNIIEAIEKFNANKELLFTTWQQQDIILNNNIFWEDNNNLLKYLDSFTRLFGKKLEI